MCRLSSSFDLSWSILIGFPVTKQIMRNQCVSGPDKVGIKSGDNWGISFLSTQPKHVVGTHLNYLAEMMQMNNHSICFQREINKENYLQLSPLFNIFLILVYWLISLHNLSEMIFSYFFRGTIGPESLTCFLMESSKTFNIWGPPRGFGEQWNMALYF